MDDILLKQLVRQLKFLNFWVTFFGTIFIIGFILAAIAFYKVASYANSTIKKFDTFQQQTKQSLDVKSKICADNSVSALLNSKTSICN